MNISEVLFLVALLASVGITLYKVLNVIQAGRLYDITRGIVYFAGLVLAWFVGLVVLLSNPQELVYITLFRVTSLFLVLNIVFLFAEIFFSIRDKTVSGRVEAYNSGEVRRQRGF